MINRIMDELSVYQNEQTANRTKKYIYAFKYDVLMMMMKKIN